MFCKSLAAGCALLFAASLPTLGQTTGSVRISTVDDVAISAAYYPAQNRGVPAVVFVHDLGQSRDDWTSFASVLQRAGIAALAIDLRGHGESTRRLTASGPQLVDYHNFTEQDYRDLLLDINAAVDWLSERPEIDKSRLGVIGAGLGANLALRYTVFNEDVAALILLSPGLNYHSVRTDDIAARVRPVPLRMVVSRYDGYSLESAKRLAELRKQAGRNDAEKDIISCSGALHGTALLKGVGGLQQALVDWLSEVLLGAAPKTPAPPATAKPPAAKPAK